MSEARSYPLRPICGVGVVAFKGEELLLVRRGKEPLLGHWSIPGGAVELGEPVRQAALREFEEECGGSIVLRDLIDVVDIISRDDSGRVQYDYVLVDFWADWTGDSPSPSSDVSDARWVRAQDLDSLELPSITRSVLEKAVAARSSQRRLPATG